MKRIQMSRFKCDRFQVVEAFMHGHGWKIKVSVGGRMFSRYWFGLEMPSKFKVLTDFELRFKNWKEL